MSASKLHETYSEVPSTGTRPLVVDLDGTLLRANLLVETAFEYVKVNAFKAIRLIGWARRGRAYLKRRLALETQLDPGSLPLNEQLVDYLGSQAALGRRIILVTASDVLLAERVAARFPFISGVVGSDGTTNLKGRAKSAALERLFPNGFDYAGDAIADLPVWQAAKRAIVVNASPAVMRAAARSVPIFLSFPRPSRWRALLKEARPHQWVKNLLIFVPAILAGRSSDPHIMWMTTLTALAFCLVASSTYILNDLWDLAEDRRHWSKRDRPLANGSLPLLAGLSLVPLGLGSGLAVAAWVGEKVLAILIGYLGLTVAYSIVIKRVPLLDCFALATLFTLRLGAGILASGARASPWLLVFSIFFFLSLSFAKRTTEMTRVVERGGVEVTGRGYKGEDLPLLLGLGIACGLAAVIIMVLYIIEDAFRESFYGNTTWLWGFPGILFLFVCRVWLVCVRGALDDDPVFFAIKDPVSWVLGGILVFCFAFAWVGFTW